MTSAAESESAKQLLMHWCLQATAFDRKRTHAAIPLIQEEVLPEDVVAVRVTTMPEPPTKDEFFDDETLDAMFGASEAEEEVGSGNGEVGISSGTQPSGSKSSSGASSGSKSSSSSSDSS